MSIISPHEQQTAWESVLEILRSQLSAPSFETWIMPLQFVDLQGQTIVLEATSAFNRDWVVKHYGALISHAVSSVFHWADPLTLDVRVRSVTAPASLPEERPLEKPSASPQPATAELPRHAWTPKTAQSQLNPRYTFDQFVVGNHNRFCHAAALAVAETPAQSYNPLFIYGGVGLGKTHLMQAIGHFAALHHPQLKVKYVTTEQFTNDLISALGQHDMNAFRNKYRRMDILMIDDIQFLEGKDRTQEEIFHTFNTLHEAGKQIIISSDRPPERLSRLEDRLRSRFSWGLIADIQPPDYETRMAIIQKKAMQQQLVLNEAVCAYVAESFPNNIRELEGAINKLSAYYMLTGGDLDLSQAQMLLGRRFDPSRVSKEDMIDVVARYYHLQRADLQSSLRTKHIAHARQVAIYVIRELTDDSYPQIGQLFGGRRHTTVLYAYEKMKELLAVEPTLRQQVQEIIDQIKIKGT